MPRNPVHLLSHPGDVTSRTVVCGARDAALGTWDPARITCPACRRRRSHARPRPEPRPEPRPPAPRCVAAYVLGYTMWGMRGRVARQHAVLVSRLWRDRRLLRWWQAGHDDAADGLPRRFTLAPAGRAPAPDTQLALLEVPHGP